MKRATQTVLAFDFGLRQIGVAVGNCQIGTTQPLAVFRAKEGIPDWTAIDKLLAEWAPDLLVVGEPLNMDGTVSEICTRARKFARRLHGRSGLQVALCDERLSSFEAKQNSREAGHRGDFKRRPVDSYAAELILQTWMAETGASGP